MKSEPRSDEDLSHEGFIALIDALGVADAIRFIQLYRPGQGDYTVERQAWLDSLPRDERLRELEKVASGAAPTKKSG